MAPELTPSTSNSQRSRRHRQHDHRSRSRDERHRERFASPPPPATPSRSPSRERQRDPSRDREHSRRGHRSRSRDKHADRVDSRPPSSGSSKDGNTTRGHSSSSKDGKSGKRPRVRFSVMENEGDALALGARATRSGFLRKQADNEPGAWNRYYFVLKPLTYLFYYNSRDDETPRGVIDLEYLTEIKRNADCLQRAVAGSDNCFRVSGKLPRVRGSRPSNGTEPKMRPLYLDTDDDEDAEEWMDAIRNHRFSLKKDEQFFEMVHQLRDAEDEVAQLEAERQKRVKAQHAVRAKAQEVLQRIQDMGVASLHDSDIDDDDDDDVLATLDAMELALDDVQAKMEQQTQLIARLTQSNAEKDQQIADKAQLSSRRNRSLTQVLYGAGNRQNVPELPEEPEEEPSSAPAPASRRGYNAQGEPRAANRPKSVSDVHGMWSAKKKSSPLSPSHPATVFENDGASESNPADIDNGSGSASAGGNFTRPGPRSGRRMTAAGDAMPPQATATARKFVTALKNRVAKTQAATKGSGVVSDASRESEEDTVSVESTDERRSGEEAVERLPRGWSKHESRGFPGSYYYAHVSGMTSWELPTEQSLGAGFGDDDLESSDDDGCSELDSDDAATNPGVSKKKKKTKKTWGFKLPRKLTMPNNSSNPQSAVVAAVAESLSPIQRGTNNHEF